MKTPPVPAPAALSIGFDDLTELRKNHARLVKEQGADTPSAEFLDAVEQFLIGAQATGRVLGEDDDRVAAQSIIDYWGTVLLRARRPLPEAVAHGLAESAGAPPTTSLRDLSASAYLAEERSVIRSRLRLSAAAAQWSERGKHSTLLWGGAQLDEAESYKNLSDVERAFLKASRAHARYVRRITGGVITAAFAAAGLIIYLLMQENQAQRKMTDAEVANREESEARGRDTKHELAAKLVERAGASAREGDVAGSLLWLVEALHTDTEAGKPDDVHRVRLGAAVAQLPKLMQMLIEEDAALICNSAEFSADGKCVLTTANALDNTSGIARLWDAATGKKLAAFPSPAGRLNRAVISAAGCILTATGESGTKRGGARLWDSAGKPLPGFEDIEKPVLDAAFSPRGDRVALIGESDDGNATVEVRETEHGKPFTKPLGWNGPIKSVAFSPDGDHIVAGGSTADGAGAVRIWSAWDGAESNVDPFPRHALPVNVAIFRPDSTPAHAHIATASGKPGGDRGEVQVWDPFTGARRFVRDQPSPVTVLVFSPDGRRLVGAGQNDTARVWDANVGTALTELPHESSVTGARYSPDGRHIITSSRDQTARIWRASNGDLALPPLYLGRTVSTPSFSPDGTLALAAAPDTACIWRVATGEPPAQLLKLEDPVRGAALSTDGKLAAAVSQSGEVGAWNLETGESTIGKDARMEEAQGVFFSGDTQLVLLTLRDSSGAPNYRSEVWTTQKPKLVGVALKHDAPVSYAAFSPDAKYVLTACAGAARIWRTATGDPVSAPLEVSGTVGFAVFTPDARYVLTASGTTTPRGGEARVWEVASGKPVTPPMTHLEEVRHASFHATLDRVITAGADDTAKAWTIDRVITASADDTAKVWTIDLAAGTATGVKTLDEHSADLVHASLSPVGDGTLAVTASYDRTAVLWDTVTNQRRAVLQHPGWINDASFSADGRFLVTAGADGTARVWEAASGDFVALLRHHGEVLRALFTPEGNIVTLSSYEPARTLVDSQRELLASGAARGSSDVPAMGARRRLAKAQIWRLPPEMTPLGELQSFAELVRLRRIDGTSKRDFRRFNRSQLESLWTGLRTGYAASFASERFPARMLLAVEESEAAGDWFAAKWHLDRLIQAEPKNADLLKRRAMASGHQHQWSETVSDYTRALDLLPKDLPKDPDLLARRAGAHAELQQWDQVLADATMAITAAPDDPMHYRRRAGAYVAKSDWENAARDLVTAIEKKPSLRGSYRRLAAVRLRQGNTKEYRNVCAQMAAKFTTGDTAGSAAWACAIGAGAIDNPEQLVELARTALAKAPDLYALHNTLGAALYRAGRYDEAIEELDQSRKAYGEAANLARALSDIDAAPFETGALPQFGRPQDWAFLVMAHAKKGRLDNAKWWFEKIETRARAGATPPAGDRVWDWLEIELLYEQARTVFESPSATATAPGAAVPPRAAVPPSAQGNAPAK